MDLSVPRARVLLLEDGTLADVIAVELVVDGHRQVVQVRDDDPLAIWIPLSEIPGRRAVAEEE